jgi:hypothetical protein
MGIATDWESDFTNWAGTAPWNYLEDDQFKLAHSAGDIAMILTTIAGEGTIICSKPDRFFCSHLRRSHRPTLDRRVTERSQSE